MQLRAALQRVPATEVTVTPVRTITPTARRTCGAPGGGVPADPPTGRHPFACRGETFHFCSAGCRTKFAADPKGYLDNSQPKAAVPDGMIYTCPMHPQIPQI